MTPIATPAGTVFVLERAGAFVQLAEAINEAGLRPGGGAVALSGGSTPAAFYQWAVSFHALRAETLKNVDWYASDERFVPLASPESNFGNAERLLLQPLAVPLTRRHPWPATSSPGAAAADFRALLAERADGGEAFDLCVLGLGEDSHTASLWPGCPLIGAGGSEFFAATEWPGRGWRLTITEAGLAACGKIVVLAFGAGKAAALREVLWGEPAPERHPAQVLRPLADRVTWLVDAPAAAEITSRLKA